MRQKKISQYNDAAKPLTGNELIEVVQNGQNVKASVRDLAGFYPISAPPASTFPNPFMASGITYTLTNTSYGCYFQRTDTGSGERVGVVGRPVPGATWQATMGARLTPFATTEFIRQGLGCTNGTGVISSQFNTQNGSPSVNNTYYANLSTFTSALSGLGMFASDFMFFRLNCDGSNISSSVSIDGGRTWIFQTSRTIASTFTPTHVGIFTNTFSSVTPARTGMGVFYWELIST